MLVFSTLWIIKCFIKSTVKRTISHIVFICLTFLQCAFSNVSSNDFSERMHSHIGYICLTFLHFEVSNLSLNCLPVRMQSHIGCICFFSTVSFKMCPQSAWITGCKVTLVAFVWFFSSAFSNVSSNDYSERMQSHIGCICLTFLHFEVSNPSSNCLPVRMQSRISCICLTFLHCVFPNVSANGLDGKRHSHIDCIC